MDTNDGNCQKKYGKWHAIYMKLTKNRVITKIFKAMRKQKFLNKKD